jgi:hypothetical protein
MPLCTLAQRYFAWKEKSLNLLLEIRFVVFTFNELVDNVCEFCEGAQNFGNEAQVRFWLKTQ